MIESCCKLEHVFETMRISASRQTRKAHSYLTGHGLLQLLPKVVCCSGVSLDGRLPTAEVLAAPDTTAVGNMKMAECSQRRSNNTAVVACASCHRREGVSMIQSDMAGKMTVRYLLVYVSACPSFYRRRSAVRRKCNTRKPHVHN